MHWPIFSETVYKYDFILQVMASVGISLYIREEFFVSVYGEKRRYFHNLLKYMQSSIKRLTTFIYNSVDMNSLLIVCMKTFFHLQHQNSIATHEFHFTEGKISNKPKFKF